MPNIVENNWKEKLLNRLMLKAICLLKMGLNINYDMTISSTWINKPSSCDWILKKYIESVLTKHILFINSWFWYTAFRIKYKDVQLPGIQCSNKC